MNTHAISWFNSQTIEPMAIPAQSIGEVLDELDRIIDSSVEENNYLGIFAYVYRRTTAQIKQAILEKQFEDNARMEMMDVAFANLYLTAYKNYTDNLDCSYSWNVAFSAKDDRLSIMQHLLLGMNAHINMDLGIAAAEVSTGETLPELKNDFMKVNHILNKLTNEMQDRVSKVSRLMIILDWMGKSTDEKIVNFSMVKARDHAWNLAGILAGAESDERKSAIEVADRTIAALGNIIINPPGILLKMALRLIASFEEKEVKTIIAKLREDSNEQTRRKR
jgi:hypothetical protein